MRIQLLILCAPQRADGNKNESQYACLLQM